MRITQNMMADRLVTNLGSSQSRISDSQLQMETGKRINAPSDDPLGAQRTLQLSGQIDGLTQFQSNVGAAQDWLQSTDTALQSITSLSHRVRDLTVQGANGTYNQTDLNAMAAEVDQLIDGIKSAAGAQSNGVYVMSGTQTTTAPYALGASDTYAGNGAAIARAIGPGVSVQVNTIGSDVLGNGIVSGTSDGKLLGTLRTISADLKAGNKTGLSTDLGTLDSNLDTVSAADSSVGATLNRLDAAATSLVSTKQQATDLLSNTRDADLTQLTVQLANQQSVYQAALKSGASVIQQSLLDFLN